MMVGCLISFFQYSMTPSLQDRVFQDLLSRFDHLNMIYGPAGFYFQGIPYYVFDQI